MHSGPPLACVFVVVEWTCNLANLTTCDGQQKALVLSAIASVCSVLDRAPVDAMPQRTVGSCAVLCRRQGGLCRPRNKQEQLLWFGRRGVALLRLLIQVVIVSMSLCVASQWLELCRALASHTAVATLPSFVSTSVTLLVSGEGYCVPSSGAWSASSCVVWASALAVPPVVVASLIPSIVTTFVLVTNVEDMANAEVARKVVHTQYLTQAFQALRM